MQLYNIDIELELELCTATGDETRTTPPHLLTQLIWINKDGHIVHSKHAILPPDTLYQHSNSTQWSYNHIATHITAIQSDFAIANKSTDTFKLQEVAVFDVSVDAANICSLRPDHGADLFKHITHDLRRKNEPIIGDSLFAFRNVNQLWVFLHEPPGPTRPIQIEPFTGQRTRKHSYYLRNTRKF